MPATKTPTVPASGPVVHCGRALATNDLRTADLNPRGWRGAAMAANQAARNGQILCLRPSAASAQWAGEFALTLGQTLALIDKGYDAWIVAVDPYDSDGEPIAFGRGDLRQFAADRIGKVAA